MTRSRRALERLAKWRMIFTGWQLGTRSKTDPEAQAVRDHREVTMFLRAEATALVGLLIKKGVFTEEEWGTALADEADELSRSYEKRFPGAKATDEGISIDTTKALEWMKDWRP